MGLTTKMFLVVMAMFLVFNLVEAGGAPQSYRKSDHGIDNFSNFSDFIEDIVEDFVDKW